MADAGAVLPGALAPEAFFGRSRELQGLRRDARSLLRGRGRSRALCARAGAGKSELLQHWHGTLFREGEILPLYFAAPPATDQVGGAADQSVQIGLQVLAFARRDPSLLLSPPAPAALAAGLRSCFGGAGALLAEALPRSDGAVPAGDPRAILLLVHHFSLASGLRVLTLLDDAGNLVRDGGAARLPAAVAAFATAPLLLALEEESQLTSLFGPGAAAVATLDRLGPLSVEACRQMARHLARIAGLQLGETAVAALEREAAGSPFYLAAIVRALGERGGASAEEVARAAATAVCDGELARYWLDRLSAFLPVRRVRATALEILAYGLRDAGDPLELGRLAGRMMKPEEEVEAALAALQRAGVVRIDCARIAIDDDPVFRDAVQALYRREFEGTAPAAVTASCAAAKVRGASARERDRDEAGFREALARLMLGWDGQQVPRILFDAPAFARERAGARAAAEGSSADAPEVTLPRIISVVAGRVGAGGSPSGCELDALAWGLRGISDGKDADVAWVVRRLAGGSGSGSQLTAFDRQVAALQAAGDLPSERLVRWALLDAPLDADGERAAANLRLMTSTHDQLAALADALGLPAPPLPQSRGPEVAPGLELEMVIPRAADSELVAARALEQLGENLGINPEDVARLKTALVEACINAFEHSGDREGRVRLWFGVAGGRLRIRVENQGRRITTFSPADAAAAGPRRRGWGLTLMRQLIDEVRIEPREDGVSLVLEMELGEHSHG